jgi:asparaginyl-tRNA synthetase
MPHLRTRTPFNSALLRFRSEAIACLTQFFAERSFVQTHTPIITSSDCEGAGEVFHVGSAHKGSISKDDDGSFFKSSKYLTVSSQLHLEALAQSVGKVWTLSPTFRAEKSDTARHLSEFYMLEAEMSFVDKMEDVMDLVTDMVREVAKFLNTSKVGKELKYNKRSGDEEGDASKRSEELGRRWNGIKDEWPRITYTEAISLLQSSLETFEHTPKWGAGLQAEHERYIAKTVGPSKEGYSPVFVTHYPKAIKPFYMLSSPSVDQDRETVECFDLLVPEACEIVGGSMREHRLAQLLESMRANGILPPGSTELSDEELERSGLQWYVDLRRWGSVPHGGFGLGFDRLLGYLAGVQNIREVVTFPRWVGRCDC